MYVSSIYFLGLIFCKSCTRFPERSQDPYSVLDAVLLLPCGPGESLPVRIFDTPGMYDSRLATTEAQEDHMRKLLRYLQQIDENGGLDVVLFVDRMNGGPFSAVDQDMIKSYHNLFEVAQARSFWKQAIVAFTFAYSVYQQCECELEEAEPGAKSKHLRCHQLYQQAFSARCEKLRAVLRASQVHDAVPFVALELVRRSQSTEPTGITDLDDKVRKLWLAIASVVRNSSSLIVIRPSILQQVTNALSLSGTAMVKAGENIFKWLRGLFS